LAGLVVLLVALYLALTSSAVLKAVVLPRVGAALNAQVTAGDILLRPLSELRLKQLEVTPTNGPTLLRAADVTVRYDLFSLIRGRFILPEISLDRPEVNVQVAGDGRSNLDPLLGQPSAPSRRRSTEPWEVDIGTVSIRGGSAVYCQRDAAGGSQCSTVTNLDLSLSGLKNGGSAKLTLNANVVQANTPPGAAADSAAARLSGDATIAMSRVFRLQQLDANLRAEVTSAAGALSLAEKLSASLALGLTAEEIRQCTLRFQRESQSLGEVRLSGPFNLDRGEGRVSFQITSVGRAALALLGAPLGLEFGDSALSGSGFVDMAERGRRYTASVNLDASRFSVKQAGRVTPVMDLQFALRGNTDLQEQTAYLERLSLGARMEGRDLISLATQRAVNLAWGRGEPRAAAPATALLAVNDLRLADWGSWLGTNVLDGIVNLRAAITSAQDGRNLTADFTNSVQRLGVIAGGQTYTNLGADFTGRLTVGDYRLAGLERGQLTCREGGVTLVTAQLTSSVDFQDNNGNVQVNAEGELPVILARHPVPNLAFTRGSLRLSSLLNWSRNRSAATVTAFIGDVAGQVGGYRLEGYSAEFELSGELAHDKLVLRRLGLSAREGTRSGGTGDVVGLVDGAAQTAQFTLNVSGLNQLALRPFLAGALGDVDVASLTLSAHGELRHDARTRPPGDPASPEAFQAVFASLAEGRGETRLRLDGSLTNLVLVNRKSARTSQPLGLELQLETTRRGDRYELGTNVVQLPPTQLATNRVTFAGSLDLSPSNAAPSALTVRSPGLDLTPWLGLAELFETGATAASPAPVPAGAPEQEPPAVDLPLREFTADLKVDNLFIRELAMKDWAAKVVVDDGKISLAPCTLRLQEAPVSASLKLDLTRPGYVYDVGLDAAQVRLGPLVDAFTPDYAGQISGDLFARLALSGAGVTGPSLQKNLRGQVLLNTTNLNFQIVTPRAKKLLTVLATALRLEALATSPLTLLTAQMDIGDGQVAIRPFMAASDAFFATAEGAIRLAPVLTNSPIDLPVQIALREDLTRQLKLVNLAPAARSNYFALPQFVKIRGTLGSPETEIDKLRLTALLAGSVGGAIGGTAGSAVQGVGSLLQGNVESAVGTLGNLIQGRKPGAATNAPPAGATNAPAATSTNAPPPARTNTQPKPNVLDLLDTPRKKN
jgi:uncharacterized protein involved in outer membrane biogenesis